MRPSLSASAVLVLTATFAIAQDPAAAPEVSEAPPAGPAPVTLSLDEAVAWSLANNLALRARLIDEEIERAKIREVLGAFDPKFFGEFSAGRSEVLFPANFPLDPSNPQSPTVLRIITQKEESGKLDFGVRGVLETGLSYELTFRSDYSKQAEETGLNPIFNNSTTLNLTQPLLRGAWSGYGQAPAELARLTALGARQTFRGAVRDKVREVQSAYFDLVFAIEDLAVKRQSLQVAEQQVQVTEVRVQSGALPRIERTSAESGRAGRRVDVVTAEARAVEAEDRLRRLILAFDRPSDWDQRLTPSERATEAYVELKSIDDVVSMAERSEPDLLRAHLAAAQAEIVLGQRENERQPRFDLVGTASVVGLDDDFGRAHRLAYSQHRGAASFGVGVSLEIPVGNRAAAARVAQGELALKKARVDLQDARTELVFQIRNQFRNIDVARRSIAARKEATRLAAEQLENERLKLELKTSTTYQVFEVEDVLNQRRTEEIRAVLDYRFALLDLSRVTALPLSELTR